MRQSRFPQIAAELGPKVDAQILAAAGLVAAKARARVPVRSGRLRNAIHIERQGFAEHAVVAGDRDAFYGHIVEHGGAHSPAQPFLVPALEGSRNEAKELVSAALRSL